MDEMDRLADLKTALYPAETPGQRLRERALAGIDAPARTGWVRPTLVAAGIAVLAAGAVAVGTIRTPQSGPGRQDTVAPAPVVVQNVGFTMRVNADGSIDFTATDLIDPAAATAALNNAGIAGRVVVHRDACERINDDDVAVTPPKPRTPPPSPKIGIMGDDTVTLRSSNYPSGGGLLVVIVVRHHYPQGTWAHVSWFGYHDVNKIPTCVQLFDPGTGADPQQ